MMWPLALVLALQTSPLEDFLAQARLGTARYRNPDSAKAAGFRPVGPDFPGMGRHWVHPSLILRDTIEAGQPTILEYAEIEGRLTLIGVAYAALVRDGTPPTALPVPADAWHFHQGTVEEESFLRSHAGLGHDMSGPKIAVLHAWIWLDNPDGVLATDNWALPYARMGYRAPPDLSRTAARALALAADDGGRAYLTALIRAVGQPSEVEMAAISGIVARHQLTARSHATSAAQLEACWAALWSDVRAHVRPEVWLRLVPVTS